MGRLYNSLLKDCPHLQLPIEKTDYAENIFWVYGVVLNADCPLAAETVMKNLERKNWDTFSLFSTPCTSNQFFMRWGFSLPTNILMQKCLLKGLYVPGAWHYAEEINRVADSLHSILK